MQAGVFGIVAKKRFNKSVEFVVDFLQFATHILPDIETQLTQLRCATSA